MPLALIASMAVTNVGITSASANTPVAIEQTTGMDAPVVEAAPELTTGIATANLAKITIADQTFTGTGSHDISLTVDGDNLYAVDGADNTSHYAILNAELTDAVPGVTKAVDVSNKKITITVADSAFDNGDTITAKLALAEKKGSGPFTYEWTPKATITLKKETQQGGGGAGANDPTPAGDAFQIPGGLTAKGSNVNAYTVGVKKIIIEGTAKDNEVMYDDIKEGTSDDNTLGEWKGAYNGGNEESNLKPALTTGLKDKYVLYYSYKTGEGQAVTEHPTYVRLLSTAETAALPFTWKTAANLTPYADNANPEAKLATEKGVMEAFVKAYIAKYYFDTGATSSLSGVTNKTSLATLIEDTETGDLKAITNTDKTYWKSTGVTLIKADSSYKDTDGKMMAGQVALPEVKSATKALTELTAKDEVIKKIIELYDAQKNLAPENKFTAHEANKVATDAETWYYEEKFDAREAVDADPDNNIEGSAERAAGTAGQITGTGWNKLKEFASQNIEKCFGETDMYAALKARAEAIYLNYLNKDISVNKKYDLDAIQWVMETQKEPVKKDAKNKDVYTKNTGFAKFWGKNLTKVTDKKTKAVSWKAAEKDTSCARVAGASVAVSNTKANGNFNAAVYLKAVTGDYTTPTAKVNKTGAGVIFSEGFYIPPAVPHAFTDQSLSKAPTGKGIEYTALNSDPSKPEGLLYTMSMDVGKSAKLPFKLKDGKDKSLVYEVVDTDGVTGFTVVNGKVTAYAANEADLATKADEFDTKADGKNIIKVYSRVNPEVCAYVQVKVNPAVKSIVTNAKKVGMWKGAKQYVSLGTNPALNPYSVQYVVENGDAQTYTVKGVSSVSGDTITYADPDSSGKFAAGINYLEISTNAEKEPTKADITVNVVAAGKTENLTAKALTINLVPVAAPQDIKSVKLGVKAKNGVVAIPEGSAANLGFTVSPVGAPTGVVDDKNHHFANGDVVATDFVEFALCPDGSLADKFKAGKGVSYRGDQAYSDVDVVTYKPGSSIRLTDEDYTIKGGFLMTAAAAETDCEKEFKAGNTYEMDAPSCGTDEPIIWKANNPAAVLFEYDEDGDTLTFTPCQTGTFTITGTTAFTKQKISFKMLVGAANKSEDMPEAFDIAVKSSDGYDADINDNGKFEVSAGMKYNAYMFASVDDEDQEENVINNGVGGPVTFALKNAADKTKATVTKNGDIKTKAGGEVTIVATMKKPDKSSLATKEFTLVIDPVDVEVKTMKAPAGVIKGSEFALSASLKNFNKNTMELQWTATKDHADPIALSAMPKDKPSGKVKLNDVGTYTITVNAIDKTTKQSVEISNNTVEVVVYEKAVSAANINNGDAKAAIARLGAKNDGTDAKKNNGVGYGYVYIPVYLSMKDSTGKVVKYDGDLEMNDITWTSSNKNLASVVGMIDPADSDFNYTKADDNDECVEESDIIKGYKNAAAVAKIKVSDANTAAYTGLVTLKGVTKNSKKAITIKLNVLDHARTFVAAYDPQTFGTSNMALANIDDSAASNASKPLANAGTDEENKKAITDAAGTKKKDKTFVMTKWVLVNGTNVKEINKDTEKLVAEPYTATVTKGEGTGTATFTFNSGAMIDAVNGPVSAITAKSIRDDANVTAGTWYLAVADVTYKIKQVHEDAVEADTEAGTQAKPEKHLLVEETAIKVTKIASKTPIVKS